MLCKLNAMELLSIHKNFHHAIFNPTALQTFKLISTFFRSPVSKVLDKVLCFILGREFRHNFFFVFFEVL